MHLLLLAFALSNPLFCGAQESSPVEPPNMAIIEARESIIQTSESRIQKEILDKILGKEKATVFVDVNLDVRASRKENLRGGAGTAEKYKEKPAPGGAFATQFILPGVPKPKNITLPNMDRPKPEAAQGQTAEQSRTEQEEIYTQEFDIKKFLVTVIHDQDVAPDKIKEIRSLIVDAMSQYKVKPEDVLFKPTRFKLTEHHWFDDLREPKVYIPLLYAGLLLLLLMFLFGPFARFLRRYVEALVQKPAAEVNIESNIEPPEGGKDEGDRKEESKLDIMLGRKPPEPVPPPPEDEEDAMKKFEPFSYINEENLKRLANLFLLRREEPWLIAVVLSYLKPEYARQVLTSLPVELQAKVAMEALTVRQVTREQVVAIDADVKENVDFVVGGIQRLTQMLEEADSQTRMNILEYLKNEKPIVYERVRKSVLLFEDIASFPDREMQVIVRELKTEGMARALQGASTEVVSKFFNNMSTGAASLLKESMDYAKDLAPAQIEEERTKIMDHIKAMEKEGKVAIRGQVGDKAVYEEVLATTEVRSTRYGPLSKKEQASGDQTPPLDAAEAQASAADPEQAQRYYQAGVQYHDAGDLDTAVKYFRQAIEFDASLWQAYQYLGAELYQMGRVPEALIYYEKVLEHNPDPQLKAWVDSFKAQMKA